MNSKPLSTGSECPPLKDGQVRIYGNRFCPYTLRILLVAKAKRIPYGIVNINLDDPPEWFRHKNPAGQVPAIETDRKGLLSDSLIISEYFEEAYRVRCLSSPDPLQKALDKIGIQNFSKVVAIFNEIVKPGNEMSAVKELLADLSKSVNPYERELQRWDTVYFGGDSEPGLLDYMIWPWFERFTFLKLQFASSFDFYGARDEKPNLTNWYKAMKKDLPVREVYLGPKEHQ